MDRMKLKDGVFAEIKSVKIVFDIVGENGEALHAENFSQSPNSVADAGAGDLDKIQIDPSVIKKSVFGLEDE